MKDLLKGLLLLPSSFSPLTTGRLNVTWYLATIVQSLVFSALVLFSQSATVSLTELILLALLAFLFWPLLLAGLLEPVFTRAILTGTNDEQELHWWRQNRDNNRRAVIMAVGGHLLVYVLIQLLTVTTVLSLLLSFLLAALWSIAWISLYLRKVLNFSWSFSISTSFIIYACGIILFLSTSLSLPGLFLHVVLLALATWFFNKDIRLRFFIWALLIDKDLVTILSDKEFQSLCIELLFQCGDRVLADKLFKHFKNNEESPDQIVTEIRMLNCGMHFMQAIDQGLMHADECEGMPGYHLAMAEASLGARDPENAAAHSEEAIDLSGGPADLTWQESKLILAMASFNQFEHITGLNSCEEILLAPEDSSQRYSRIRKEAKLFRRRFYYLNMEREVVD
jgi:hypothetical protein